MIYLGIGVGDGQTKAQFRRVYTGIGIVRRGGRTRSTGKAPPLPADRTLRLARPNDSLVPAA